MTLPTTGETFKHSYNIVVSGYELTYKGGRRAGKRYKVLAEGHGGFIIAVGPDDPWGYMYPEFGDERVVFCSYSDTKGVIKLCPII